MSKVNANHSMILKIALVGDSGVGKTSLLLRETEQRFMSQYLATIGVDFKIKTYQVGKISAKVQIWDPAGQQRFRTITRAYYRGTHAVCLCFDLSNRQSLISLPKWLDEIKSYNIQVPIYLVGCKSDLDMEIATDEILTFAEAYQVNYLQTSAKQDVGVSDGFRKIVQETLQNNLINMAFQKQQQKLRPKGMELSEQKVQNQKTSCSC